MVAEAIFIGTELLLGQIVNTNAAYLCENLAALGVNVHHTSEVGDNVDRIAEAVRLALSRADLVITSGGLGPTADDVTRQAVAKAIGRKMVFKQEIMDGINALFRRMGAEARPIQRSQAYVFETGCEVIPNPIGSAPGLLVDVDGKHIAMLPGVPGELKRMCSDFLFPWIRKHSGAGIIKSLPLKVCGLGESTVQEMVEDIMADLENPTIAFLARPGEVTLRITAKGKDEQEAMALIRGIEEKVRRVLGENIYGIDPDTLEEVTGRLLSSAGRSVAIAETTTGGWVTSRLASVNDSPKFLAGSIVLTNAESLARATGIHTTNLMDENTVRELAASVRNLFGCYYGMAVSAVLDEKDGTLPVGLTRLALDAEGGTVYREMRMIGDKPTMKQRISQAALDLIRRQLI